MKIKSLLLVLLLAATSAQAGETFFLSKDRRVSCRVTTGFGVEILPNSFTHTCFEFDNPGAPLNIEVRMVQSTAIFSVPTGKSRRFLYNIFDYLYTPELKFFDADSGKPLATGAHQADIRVDWDLLTTSSSSSGKITVPAISVCEDTAINTNFDSGYELQIKNVPAEILPDLWLGYTGISMVYIDYTSWRNPAVNKAALIDWMSAGGYCFIIGVPDEEKAKFVSDISAEAAFVRSFQDGAKVGLGGFAFITKQFMSESHANYFSRLGFTPTALKEASVNPQLMDKKAPFALVFIGLFAFSILVGPGGWWYLVKKKKKALLYYFAAPAISIIAVAITISSQVIVEGFWPHTSCNSITFIDQRVNRAIDMSNFSVYIPVGVSLNIVQPITDRPFIFSEDGDRYNRRDPLNITQAGDRRIISNAVKLRTPTCLARTSVGTERRRLIARYEDGKVIVENYLEQSLRQVFVSVKDKDGKVIFASVENLEPNEKREAQIIGLTPKQHIPPITLEITQRLVNGQWNKSFLEGQGYFAEAKTFRDEQVWFKNAKDKGSESWIYGIY